MADATDSKSVYRKVVGVQVPSPAPFMIPLKDISLGLRVVQSIVLEELGILRLD
jgi:hypothetical protein